MDIDDRTHHRTRRTGIALAAALAVLAVAAPTAGAATTATTTANANLTAGALQFVQTPSVVNFTDTLNGANQTATASQSIDVGDSTGSGAGWNVTATSTTFATSGGTALPANAVNANGYNASVATAPTVACDSGVTCTPAQSNTATGKVNYPYYLPNGSTAPTATKLFSAAASSGMGDQTLTVPWSLAIPASSTAGSYTSTWTFSLVSAP